MCNQAKAVFAEEVNVLSLHSPLTLCGDIHGQFNDLLSIVDIVGDPRESSYLFMGDFVDRGPNSIETFLLLLALKVRYPHRVWLIRGNHESRQISRVYGFYDECIRKYGSGNVWQYCCEVFDHLPLAAVVDRRIFVVHGGLSPFIDTVGAIQDRIHRFQEPPTDGSFSDLLWSDPDEGISEFAISSRGAGTLFGNDAVDKFLHLNNLDLIARAHQLVMEGYKWMFNSKLVTVWSAPNYCFRCGNLAAVLSLDEESRSRTPIVFDSSRTPVDKLGDSIIEYFA